VLAAGVALVMAIGLVGTVVPVLPGTILIWGAALVYGLAGTFGRAGAVAMTAITILLLTGTAAKYVLAHRRARVTGAPTSTIAAGALGGIIGFFAIPVIGFVLGGVLGILFAERRRTNDWERAWASTRHVLAGFGIGVLVEVGAGLAMIGCWVVWVLL
jgi:uncharacterized protein